MQREHNRRGFTIRHQKVALDIDFGGSIRGYTDVTIVPTTGELKSIYLHCRQCTIESVTVASHKADFLHRDPLASLTVSNPKDCHNYPELKRKLFSAYTEGEEGELVIGIPGQVSLKQTDITIPRSTPDPTSGAAPLPAPEFAPLLIHIEYSLRRPIDGLQFVLPTDANPYRVPHLFTAPSSPDASRCWVPCLDNPWEKCTWDFEFVVPKYLEERDQERMKKHSRSIAEEDAEDECPTMVVCSGELVEQVAHPFISTKTIFLFSLTALTSVQHIAFAAGPFYVHSIPVDAPGEDASSQPQIDVFCLPGAESSLVTTTAFLRSAMTFYTDIGQYPYSSYKVVFVDELLLQHFDAATMSLASTDVLHDRDALDQVYEARQVLSHALACQWSGVYVQPKTFSDIWLINGISLYIAGLYLKKHFGLNEYRFRMKKDMERVIARDVGTMPPVCQPGLHEPPDAANLNFINLKSPLILHILDRKLGKSGTSLGLSRALPKIFLSAISGDMHGNALSTNAFLRTCRKVSGVDLRAFADQWIYGSGCPSFTFSANFNRKRMAVEITMRQDCPAHLFNEHDSVALALLKPVPFFEGQMTIRIHEADGTPYEHVLDLRTNFKRYEVPFNTKYKRVRRNTKRFLARQAAAAAAAQGDVEAAEAIGSIDMGFGLEVWENIAERENWKVADWTEEDEQVMSSAVYEWIRLDADFEWISSIAFEQADYMWVSQLQRDRDVVAQLEAVNALARQPSLIVSSTLTKTALVANYFFRIRVEAVLALVNCAIRRLDFIGLFHLFKMFLRYCYNSESVTQELFRHEYVPRPNDFSDIADYFVRKGIITAISLVRLENGKSPPVVRQFLIDQLRYNDNTNNPYADALYICNIIAALATSVVPDRPPERGELRHASMDQSVEDSTAEDRQLLQAAVTEVVRYRNMDRLVPSTHNIVTVAALEFHMVLCLANLIPHDCKPFLACSRDGNYSQVRLAAFDGLLLSRWYAPKVMRYIFSVIAHDSSILIRRHVARSICESLALQFTVGEIKNISKDGDSLLVEEDGVAAHRSLDARRHDPDQMLKSLKKDKEIGRNEVLREAIMPLLLAQDVDYDVRWAVLKLADIALRGAEEALPKMVIHLPPTPVAEHAPLLPIILAKPKATRKDSIHVATPKTPSASTPTLAKIRLPVVAHRPLSPEVTSSSVNKKAAVSATVVVGKKKKTKVPPKGQSSGMTANDLRACRNALKRLNVHKSSLLFRQPVDPIRDRAPNYFDIIKAPMDLSTMGMKLESGMYNDRFKFEEDFRLMINNAKEYNAPGSYPYKEASALEDYFAKQWSRIQTTLERAGHAQPKVEIADMDVDSAIASVLDLDGSQKPSDPVPPKPALSVGATKLKLKLGGITNGTKEQPAKLSNEARPDAKLLPSVRQNASGSKIPNALAQEVTADDFLLQEVIALEQTKPQRNGDVRSREATPLHSGSKSNGTSTPKPTLKIKRLLPDSARASNGVQENTASSSSDANPPANESIPIPINEKKCKEILKTLRKIPECVIFLLPVDPIRDGCPTYYDEIKHPMDFQTVQKNLDAGKYKTLDSFVQDVEQIFINCRQFNPPLTSPVQCADIVEKAWRKELTKAQEKRLSPNEKRGLQGLMNKLMKEDALVFFFRIPVDPVLLQIPDYYKVIPKKDARDLRTIRTKLDSDKYETLDAFEADVQLMVDNAVKFNGAASEVGIQANALLNFVKELLEGVRTTTTKKRKEEQPNATPSKKVKLS